MFEAICEYYGVEVGTYPQVNNNKMIYFYDNTLTGKKYIQYLAELFGGNAKIERDGSCSIIPLKKEPEDIIIEAVSSKKFELGETYELSRVCYDNGLNKWYGGGNVISVDELPTENIDINSHYYLTTNMKYYKYYDDEWHISNEIKNTLYLRTDNLFITSDFEVNAIYNAVKDFSITNITCENRMDFSLDSWDIIQYIIDENIYYTYYDNVINYNGVAMGTVKVNIPLKVQEETTNIITSSNEAKIRRIKTTINEQENSIQTVIDDINNNYVKNSTLEQTVDGITTTITDLDTYINGQITDINQRIDGLSVNIRTLGGNNIFYYAKEFWQGTIENSQPSLDEYTDTELKQLAISQKGYIINNGVSEQKVSVKNNENYTISFYYKKLKPLATGYVYINNNQYELGESTWTEFKETYTIDTNTIDIRFVSDTDEAFEIYDLLGNVGTEKEIWTQNPNETRTDTVTIGKGIQVNSTTTNTYTRIDADGNRVYNQSTNEVITEMTDKGIVTDNIQAKKTGEIGGILIQEIDSQTWISSLL